jgi:hypothetical protein
LIELLVVIASSLSRRCSFLLARARVALNLIPQQPQTDWSCPHHTEAITTISTSFADTARMPDDVYGGQAGAVRQGINPPPTGPNEVCGAVAILLV